MCFSAAASFTAGVALTSTGVVAVQHAKRYEDRFLALIPVLFGIQQLFEGLVWVTPHPSPMGYVFAYAFLFFALLVWPFYSPLAAWAHEKNPQRKAILKYMTVFGAASSLYLLAVLLTQYVSVEVVGNSLFYNIPVPLEVPGIMLYIAITVGSFLLSTNKFLKLFGIVLFVSAWIAWQMYTIAFTSAWCFFAAVISLMIVVYFTRHGHEPRKKTRKR